MSAGFDGIYLDRVDVYQEFEQENPAAGEQMIAFVKAIAAHARSRKPGFLVVPQNAEELLDEADYRAVIDGIAKEDLLFGEGRSKYPNKPQQIETHVRHLKQMTREREAGVCGRVSRQARGHRGRQKADRGVRASSRILPSVASTSCASATCRRRRDNARRARSSCGSGGGRSPGRLAVAALRQSAHRGRFPTVRCAGRLRGEIARLLKLLALPARSSRLYPLGRFQIALAIARTRRQTESRAFSWRARAMAPNHVTLDDKYDLGEEPDLRHRLPGAGAPLPDAEGARPPRRAQYRRLCHRLSRLAARRARPAVHRARSARSTSTTSCSRPASTRTSPPPRSGARSRRSCAAKASSMACSASGTARGRASTAPATCSATPISPAPRSTAACWR